MLRSASIEMRLRNVSAINACLLIVAGMFGAVSLQVADRTVQDVVSRLDPLAEVNREVVQTLIESETGVRGFLVTGSDQFLEPYLRGSAAFEPTLDQAVALASDDPTVIRLLEAQRAAGHLWLETFAAPIVELRRRDPVAAQAWAVAGEGKRMLDAFRAVNADTQTAIAALQHEAAGRVADTTTVMTVLAMVVALVAAGVGLALARRAAHWVTRPLRRLGSALDHLTGGDLSTRVAVAGPTEVRDVARSLNKMAGQMERLTRLERRRVTEERLIRTTSRTFLRHLEEDLVLQTAAETIGRALEVDRTSIWGVRDRSVGDLRARWTPPGDPVAAAPERPPPELVDVVRNALQADGVAHVDDVDVDPSLSAPARRYLQRLGVRSILLAPVAAFDEEVAVLCIERCRQARPWTATEVAVALGVARELRIAVEHARVFAQQRATVEELQRLDDAKAEFVSSVSHELRTPLASIVGYTELLLDGDAGDLGDQPRAMMRVVDRNARRLLALIDDLLMLSRLDTGRLRERRPVGVGDLVDEAVAAVGPLTAQRGLVVRVEKAPDLPAVWGDHDDLERVLINLISNALKFTEADGSVSVTASTSGGEVVIAVTDTGVGIPEDEVDQLFTRFFRSSVAREAQIQGTGLGLAIVKGIVEEHGGRVEVESVLGAGTTFRVRLPIAEAPEPVPASRPEY